MSFQSDVEEVQRQIMAVERVIVNSLDETAMIPAEMIADEAQRRAPRRSGRLERTINAVPSDSGRANVGQAAIESIFYGRFREFGTRYQAPDPFLRPAADTQEKPGLRAIESFLQAKINGVAK